MYSRNQYYQPYQAKKKQKDEHTGQKAEENNEKSQQSTSSPPSNPSTSISSSCNLSSIFKSIIFLAIFLSASGGLVFWFLNYHNSAQETHADSDNIASKLVIDRNYQKDENHNPQTKASKEFNYKEIKVLEKKGEEKDDIPTLPELISLLEHKNKVDENRLKLNVNTNEDILNNIVENSSSIRQEDGVERPSENMSQSNSP